MENILEFIIRGVGMIIAVAAITFFISSQMVLNNIINHENKSDIFQTDNATQRYEEYILGHELINQIYNDDLGINFQILNTSGSLVLAITDCNDLNQLTSINPITIYDITKQFTGNKLTQLTYKER